MRSARRIALIGFGAIGEEIHAALQRLGESERLAATLVRAGRVAPRACHAVPSLLASAPDVVIECAGHGAVAAYVEPLLRAGVDVIVSSVGALADDALRARLTSAEHDGGGRMLLPPGAIAGLDGLVAAQLAGIDQVRYTSSKPPHAWRGTPAESLIDLDHAESEVRFFDGSAREAALAYPKNVNVGIAVALASLGMDRTRVRLVSSRRVGDPLGVIEAEGAFGHFRFEILATATADNPKTSALTAYSLLQCARLGTALPVSMLLRAT